jgi:hypothetical protein
MLFDDSLGYQSRGFRHSKAAVLLLSFAEHLDDLQVQPEVGSSILYRGRAKD